MLQSAGKIVVVCLVIIGALNFHALNKKAFSSITTTITTKPLGEIPGGVVGTVTGHKWRFVR